MTAESFSRRLVLKLRQPEEMSSQASVKRRTRNDCKEGRECPARPAVQHVERCSAWSRDIALEPRMATLKIERADGAVSTPRTAAFFVDFSNRQRPTLGPNCASKIEVAQTLLG